MIGDAPRGRGRPKLRCTVRDLRTLKPWARALVLGRGDLQRYRNHGSLIVDRSRADFAAVGAMVAADWSDDQIFAAFSRADWWIGDRVRELHDLEGWKRASDYLARTIQRARESVKVG